MARVADIVGFLRREFPLALAAEWDNVGLLFGDAAAPARRVMTCLTVTPPAVEEAIGGKANLIVSHHPILFRGAKRLTTESAEGEMLWRLARAGIAVYSPHTAFDNAAAGINEFLAEKFGLEKVRPLRSPSATPSRECKLVVFVPETDLQRVSDALFAAGAGVIGEYRECSYRVSGTGTFFGTDATNPTIGEKGRREEVAELRLEMVCPLDRLAEAVAALRRAHSYEEPAFDIYPLLAEPSGTGEGRIGVLSKAVKLRSFARLVQDRLGARGVRYSGDGEREVTTVAVACGAAGEFLQDAIAAGADVFVCGEMRFHDILTAQASGIGVVLAGHYASERPAVEHLAELLAREFPKIEVWAARAESDPLTPV